MLLIACAGLRAQTAKPVASAPAPVSTTQGEALDRVVAIVNGDLVLESDVDEERRMASLQVYRDPSGDYSRERAVERLIDRTLILQQAKLQQEAPITDDAVNAELTTLRKDIPACKQYKCETQEGWERFLKENGFTEKELVTRWRERMEVLRYIDIRFRNGIQITPAERRTYYEQTMLPEYEKQHVKAPLLDTMSDRVDEVLLQQRVTNLLSDWLKSLRAQGSVVMMKQGDIAQ